MNGDSVDKNVEDDQSGDSADEAKHPKYLVRALSFLIELSN